MRPYQKLYYAKFGFDQCDDVYSEVSQSELCNDIHHINARGSGGTIKEERIENLIALTRYEHTKYGDKKQYKSWLFMVHKQRMVEAGVEFDEKWIDNEIRRWSGYA